MNLRKVVDLGAVRNALARLDAIASEHPEAFGDRGASEWEALLREVLGPDEEDSDPAERDFGDVATRLRTLGLEIEARSHAHPEVLRPDSSEGRAVLERFVHAHRIEIRTLLATVLGEGEED